MGALIAENPPLRAGVDGVGAPNRQDGGVTGGLIPSSQMRWGLGGGGGPDTWGPRAGSFHPPQKREGGALKVELGESPRSLRPEPLAPVDQGFPQLTGTQIGACITACSPPPSASLGPPPGAPLTRLGDPLGDLSAVWAADQEREAETWRESQAGGSREGREERTEVRSGNCGGWGREGEPQISTKRQGGGRCRVEKRGQGGAAAGLGRGRWWQERQTDFHTLNERDPETDTHIEEAEIERSPRRRPPPPRKWLGKKIQNETDTDGGRERDTQRERHRHTNLEIEAETHRERECTHVPQTAGSRWKSKTPGRRCSGRDRNRKGDLKTDIETHA